MGVIVVCPNCGKPMDIFEARLHCLSKATLRILKEGGRRWREGLEELGTDDLARRAGVAPSTAHYHLSILVAYELVNRIPERKEGRKYQPKKTDRQRHTYKGALSREEELKLFEFISNNLTQSHDIL